MKAFRHIAIRRNARKTPARFFSLDESSRSSSLALGHHARSNLQRAAQGDAPYGIFLLLIVVSLFCSSIALCDTVYFRSEDEFADWVMYYYLKPEPEKIPTAIKFYCDSSIFEESNTRMPMAAFFAALLKNNIGLMEKTYEEISAKSSDNSKILTLNILWLVNTPKSKELINGARIQWKSEPVQKIIERMNGNLPNDILISPVEDALHLDMLWWTFFATGDSTPIKKIISVIHLKEDGHGMEIVTGGAAEWSLTSNAYQHQRVYEICKEELKNSEGQTRKLLEEIIKNVDQRKTKEQSGKT